MTYIGRPLKRFEDHRLLMGMGSFVEDITLPDMVHAQVLRSPHAHAIIRAIDVSQARNLPGVLAVLTGADLADVVTLMPLRSLGDDQNLDEMNAPDWPVLATDKVCYVGQPVAVVVAEESYQAKDGVGLIQVDYELLTPVIDPDEALKENTTLVHGDLGTNVGLRFHYEGGDVEKAFAGADKVVRQRYYVPRLAPAPLENRGVLAQYQPQEDHLTVWSSTQEPHQVWVHVAEVLKRPQSSIRVIAPDVGGGFGEKGPIFPEEVAIPYLAITLRRPVKWIEDRQEHMLAVHARGYYVDQEVAVKSDGTLLGMRVRAVADLGAYFLLSTTVVPPLAGHRINGPYKTPSARIDVVGVITNKPSTCPYRGAGGPESAFAMERTMDLVAKDLGLDPVEVRRKNLIPSDAFPYTTSTGLTYDSGDYERGMDRVLELSEYRRWRERAGMRGPEEPLLGVGVATVVKASGGAGYMREESARLTIESSGQITAYTGVSPHGQGTATSFAQIVATELGVTPAEVEVVHGDTALFHTGGGTEASRGTPVGAAALYLAVQDARSKLAQLASHVLKCPGPDVSFDEGRVFDRRNPDSTVSFAELAAAAYNEEMLPPDITPGLDFAADFRLPRPPFGSAAHVAVVEVDRDTGDVKIIRYFAVHDAGRIINPFIVDGQMHGGIAQGIGQALTEGMIYDSEGQPMTGSFLDYGMPVAEDMSAPVLDTFETLSPITPHGAKGLGELPTVAAPVVVANAVMDALAGAGVRHIDTPLTPEKIWRDLHGRQG